MLAIGLAVAAGASNVSGHVIYGQPASGSRQFMYTSWTTELGGAKTTLSQFYTPFYGFVPAVRFAFGNQEIGERFHSPYDTVDSVQDQGRVMEQSAAMALIVALKAPLDAPDLRVTPKPERRALIIATHTEVLHMMATNLVHLDRALAWEGFDVDVIPYGQPFTAADLADADLGRKTTGRAAQA